MGIQYKQELFESMPVVGILRNIAFGIIEDIIPHYKKAGFSTLEITLNSENAIEIISHLSNKHPDINIGAGTVCSMDDLAVALQAGASFIVSPILNEDVVNYCTKNGIPVFPGAFTPLEIYKAASLGATAVKLFPANQLGPGYIKDVLAPLNTIKLLPTGGISVDNMESFFKAGAIGVGMGGSLFDAKLIANKDYERLYHHFKQIAGKVLLRK